MRGPFRTLAGRLVLLTVAAIAVSFAAAFALFSNERSRAIGRLIEARIVEHVVVVAGELRSAAPSARADIFARPYNRGLRLALRAEPSVRRKAASGAAGRVARAVSRRLNGVETRAELRPIGPPMIQFFRARPGDPPAPPTAGAAAGAVIVHNGAVFDADLPAAQPPALRVFRDGSTPPRPPPLRDGETRLSVDGNLFVTEGTPPPPPEAGTAPRIVAMGAVQDVAGERQFVREPRGKMLAVFDRAPPALAQMVVSVEIRPGAWLEAAAALPPPEAPPKSFLFAGFGAVLIVGLGAALIARQISRPMANLAAAAAQFAQGATDIRLPVEGPDDVRRASEAFNAMAARLGGQMRRQKQMLWALSHDLRTPITALRLRAELLEDSFARAKILAQLADMEALTEQALMLARAGAGEESVRVVDLSDIARTLCAEMRELGFSIDVAAPHSVFAPCRPDEIARAVRNLSENAAKYAGSGLISVSRGKAAAFVDVTDEGPGIAADLIGRVSEPFFRVDAARSDPGGAGLGLAIVQAVADSHGGRLVLENLRPRGLRARLVIPLRDS